MDLSGIIFVVLAVAWAVYLIPKALKHHDEVARTRSIDRFSTAMRVLARREPVNRRDARLVVSPARAQSNPRVLTPTRAADLETPSVVPVTLEPAIPRARLVARRKAARSAARRRRHILTLLLLCTAGTAAAVYLAYVPWWSVAIPGGLALVYLFLCRTQVRRESLHDLTVLTDQGAEDSDVIAVPRHATLGEGDDGTPLRCAGPSVTDVVAPVDENGVAEFDDTEDTVGLEVANHDTVIVTESGGSLWDPLPVTLPTYVTKAKARRTVRTIDLGEPGTWTSARTDEDARIVVQAAEEAESKANDKSEERRAFGS